MELQPTPGMGMVRPAGMQMMPGVPGALPSFSALPGPPGGGPSAITATVKIGTPIGMVPKGFTGFTGLVPAAGTEPGAFQKPAAGERLMVWNGAGGMPEQQQAAKLEVPVPTDIAQVAGSQASVAAAPRASSEDPPAAAASSRPGQDQEELEAWERMELKNNTWTGHMDLPKKAEKK